MLPLFLELKVDDVQVLLEIRVPKIIVEWHKIGG
jgi:hypothetical protein